jgi:hypothetical protein
VRSQISCDGGTPSAASASACGGWGGCSSTMRRPPRPPARAQQAHLADAGLLQQQVDQGAGRPAAARQLRRQGRMAGVDTAA